MTLGRLATSINLARIRRANRVAPGVAVAPTARARGSVLHEGVRLADLADVRDSEVGAYTSIGRNTKVVDATFGRYCAVSWDSTINAVSHPLSHATVSAFPYVRRLGFVAKDRAREAHRATIGHDVWIGAHVVVLPGIEVGTGAVIGARAVITRDVPPYAIVAGVPARVIGARFPDDIAELLMRSEWWLAPRESIRANVHLFQVPVTVEVARETAERLGPSRPEADERARE